VVADRDERDVVGVGGGALVVRPTVQTVADDADRPEEVRVEADESQQQPDHQPTSHRRATERAGAERVTDDQVAFARDRHDQPHRVVADLHVHQRRLSSSSRLVCLASFQQH